MYIICVKRIHSLLPVYCISTTLHFRNIHQQKHNLSPFLRPFFQVDLG